jgi:TatD DNase family protein
LDLGAFMYIDAHCHLADPRYVHQLESVLENSQKSGISAWIQGGVDPQDWERQNQLSLRYPGQIFPACGFHPWWVAEHFEKLNGNSSSFLAKQMELLRRSLFSAIGLGELGLDFSKRWPETTHSAQILMFKAQLKVAIEFELPLILHIVQAHPIALEILKETGVSSRGGIVHSFSSSPEIAQQYVKLGLSLSISGAVTRKGFESLKRTVIEIPFKHFTLETDCPDQAPVQWLSLHGKLNQPASLLEIAQTVAKLRNEEVTTILEESTVRAKQIFQIGQFA